MDPLRITGNDRAGFVGLVTQSDDVIEVLAEERLDGFGLVALMRIASSRQGGLLAKNDACTVRFTTGELARQRGADADRTDFGMDGSTDTNAKSSRPLSRSQRNTRQARGA